MKKKLNKINKKILSGLIILIVFSIFINIFSFVTASDTNFNIGRTVDLGQITDSQPIISINYVKGGTQNSDNPIQESIKVNSFIITGNNEEGMFSLTLSDIVDDCSTFCNTHHFTLPSELSSGTYSISLTVENEEGKEVLDTIGFSLTDLLITLEEPVSGISDHTNYDVIIKTFYKIETEDTVREIEANTTCRYYLGNNPPEDYDSYNNNFEIISTDGSYLHKISDLETVTSNLNVVCAEYSNGVRTRITNKIFNIGYDNSPPNFLVIERNPEVPDSVEDWYNPYSTLNIEIDDLSYCSIESLNENEPMDYFESTDYDSYLNEHSKQIFFDRDDGSNIDVKHSDLYDNDNYSFSVTCTNKAGLSATQNNIIYSVNLKDDIIITPIYPDDYTTPNFELVVNTNVPGECEYGHYDGAYVKDGNMNPDDYGMTHQKSFTLTTGDYSTIIKCFSPTRDNYDYDAEITMEFTVDDEAPNNLNISTDGTICGNTLSAVLKAKDDYELSRIEWRLYKDNNDYVNGGNLSTGSTTNYAYSITQVVPDTGIGTNYRWEITAYDAAENTADFSKTVQASSSNADSCLDQDFIHYYTPEMGYSDSNNFDMIIETNRDANCRYLSKDVVDLSYPDLNLKDLYDSHALPMDKIDNTHFKIPDPFETTVFGNSVEFYFYCEDRSELDGGMKTNLLIFGLEDDAPNINQISANPDFVSDLSKPWTIINATTDQETVCWLQGPSSTTLFDNEDDSEHSTYVNEHSIKVDYNTLNKEEQEFTYNIICQNKVGLTENSDDIDVTVYFNAPFTIGVLEPNNYIGSNTAAIKVEPTVTAICTHKTIDDESSDYNTMTQSGNQWSTTASNLDEGAHSMKIKCVDTRSRVVERNVNFEVDLTEPNTTFDSPSSVCENKKIKMKIESSDPSGIELINFTIPFPSTSITLTKRTNRFEYTFDPKDYLNGSDEETYTFSAYALDNVGFSSNTTFDVKVLSEESCTACGNGQINVGEECDGNNFRGKTCESLGGIGNLSCNNCEIDYSDCSGDCDYNCTLDDICESGCQNVFCNIDPDCNICGNEQINIDEECDGNNFGNKTCESFGGIGNLNCNNNCEINYSNCLGTCDYNCTLDNICESGCQSVFCNADPDCVVVGNGTQNSTINGSIIVGDNNSVTNQNNDPDIVKNNQQVTCGFSCVADDYCEPGCANDYNCNFDPDCDDSSSKINIIGIILLVLGLLITGGSSYYLYYEYENKEDPIMPSVNEEIKQMPVYNPEFQKQMENKRREEVETFKKHIDEKEKKREINLSAFDDDKSTKNNFKNSFGEKPKTKTTDLEQFNTLPELEKNDNEFIPIEQLGHNKQKTTKNIKNDKKIKETFKELDEMINNKKEKTDKKDD